MEKVVVKIELERDDISTMMRLIGYKLSDEQWEQMKGKECVMCDEDMDGQALQMKLALGAFAAVKLLKEE